jgi:hypothetical protein
MFNFVGSGFVQRLESHFGANGSALKVFNGLEVIEVTVKRITKTN